MNKMAATTEKEIDNLLKEIKKKTGLTQDQIAKSIGYSRSYVSQAKKTDSEKLYNAIYTKYREKLENITTPEREANYGTDAMNNIAYSNRVLADANNTLADANKTLANANNTLADAHHIISESNRELLQIAKLVFSFHKPELAASGKQEPKGGVQKAADELHRTGRTGPFSQAGKGKRPGN